MVKKIKKKQGKKEFIKIKVKTLWIISPIIAIALILLSKNKPGELLLFLIGVITGTLLYRSMVK